MKGAYNNQRALHMWKLKSEFISFLHMSMLLLLLVFNHLKNVKSFFVVQITQLHLTLCDPMNCCMPGFPIQAGFRRSSSFLKRQRNQRSSCQHPLDHWKKQESSRKTSISSLLTMTKALTVWITINCEKFFKRWQYQTTWPASWEIYIQVRKQQLELDMEQQTGSK